MGKDEKKLGWLLVKMWRDYEAIWKEDATLEGFLRHLELNCRPAPKPSKSGEQL